MGAQYTVGHSIAFRGRLLFSRKKLWGHNYGDIAAARKKLGMSQDKFALTFGISTGALRNWEQGRRQPEGPARVLLKVIDQEPEAVKRAIAT